MPADGAILNPLHVGELVIDGGTLSHILGTDMEQELAKVGAQCGSVVICRSSPSQKASIVQMMIEYEMSQVCHLSARHESKQGAVSIVACCPENVLHSAPRLLRVFGGVWALFQLSQ